MTWTLSCNWIFISFLIKFSPQIYTKPSLHKKEEILVPLIDVFIDFFSIASFVRIKILVVALLLLLLSYHVFVLMSAHASLILTSGLSKYIKNVSLKVLYTLTHSSFLWRSVSPGLSASLGLGDGIWFSAYPWGRLMNIALQWSPELHVFVLCTGDFLYWNR